MINVLVVVFGDWFENVLESRKYSYWNVWNVVKDYVSGYVDVVEDNNKSVSYKDDVIDYDWKELINSVVVKKYNDYVIDVSGLDEFGWMIFNVEEIRKLGDRYLKLCEDGNVEVVCEVEEGVELDMWFEDYSEGEEVLIFDRECKYFKLVKKEE
jgi:hypothetical protein